MSQIALEVSRIREPLAKCLATKLELHPEDAGFAVDHLIRSEQAGKSSHGLIRIPYVTTSGKFGPYGNVPAPSPEHLSPGRLRIDGANHFGYALLHRLIASGCEEAKRNGVCVATNKYVYPSGALGDWARLAAKQGVGVALVASSPRRVAPLGGSRPVVGTNAVCIGIPTTPLPFVGDSATSQITHGALLLARAGGKALPPMSAVGSDGQPTTSVADVDPTKGLGALLPFGGSHKAFALSMGIELLASLGGGVPGEIQAGKHGVFCLFLGPQFFSDRLPILSDWLRSQDQAGTRIPGWVSGRQALAQQQRGIVEAPEETVKALASILSPNDLRPVANVKGIKT